jgi:hypothetical protein
MLPGNSRLEQAAHAVAAGEPGSVERAVELLGAEWEELSRREASTPAGTPAYTGIGLATTWCLFMERALTETRAGGLSDDGAELAAASRIALARGATDLATVLASEGAGPDLIVEAAELVLDLRC